jgi:hypothetical protein
LLQVSEAGDGIGDRNGDGDTLDTVACVYDLADGSLTELGLALALGPGASPAPVAVGDVLAAFAVRESAQGGVDLNGDGDALDDVMHVYDANTGLVTSTALAASGHVPALGAGSVAFAVLEEAQADTDLDGDGTTLGSVLHVFDARTGLATNAQRNVTSGLTFVEHVFAFTTDEASSAADLNADGDMLDETVFETYDLVLGGVTQVPLAIRGQPFALGDDEWFLLVDELQSGRDLDGDGDLDAGVLHRVHPHAGTHVPLGISSAEPIFRSATSAALVAVVAQELDGLDRNGDGDLDDSVVVVLDTDAAMTHVGRAMVADGPLAFVGARLAFLASESAEGLDLDLDGDLADDVLHVLDGSDGALTNTGLDAESLTAGGGLLVFRRSELGAGLDHNGDGDLADVVVFHADAELGGVASTGLAGHVFGAVTGRILVLTDEASQGADLNGDGDELDAVLVLHEPRRARSTNLGVALTDASGILLEDGRGVALVSEAQQGEDLNGDGDLDDSVLHALSLGPAAGRVAEPE